MWSIYLKAIKIQIQDAFPQSKVTVFSEESSFSPESYAIKAYVDRYGAYVTIDRCNKRMTERHVADLLIALIKEQMKK